MRMGNRIFSFSEFLSPMIVFTDALVVLACMTGDLMLQESDVARNAFIRAFTDSACHGFVAALSWIVVEGVSCQYETVRNICICGALGMAMDVDHFIAAKSVRLKDALSLTHRPPFHTTTIIPIAVLLVILLSRFDFFPSNDSLPWIIIVSILSHHLRDGHRRGLWFWPCGSTPPLPKALYLTSVAILPLCVRLILMLTSKNNNTPTTPPLPI